jgi:hypothetical protein
MFEYMEVNLDDPAIVPDTHPLRSLWRSVAALPSLQMLAFNRCEILCLDELTVALGARDGESLKILDFEACGLFNVNDASVPELLLNLAKQSKSLRTIEFPGSDDVDIEVGSFPFRRSDVCFTMLGCTAQYHAIVVVSPLWCNPTCGRASMSTALIM